MTVITESGELIFSLNGTIIFHQYRIMDFMECLFVP